METIIKNMQTIRLDHFFGNTNGCYLITAAFRASLTSQRTKKERENKRRKKTHSRLDIRIVLARGKAKEHKKRLLETLTKLLNSRYRASENKSKFNLKEHLVRDKTLTRME